MTAGTVVGVDKHETGMPPRRPFLRTVFHPLRGSSRARNAGFGWSGRADEAYEVLSATRPLLESCWVQNRWYARPHAGRPWHGRGAAVGDTAVGGCLVGAVVQAAARQDKEVGPALDLLWDAWQQTDRKSTRLNSSHA